MEQSSERVSDWVAGQAPAHTQAGDWASSRRGAGRQTSVADGMGRGWVLRSRGSPGSAGVGGLGKGGLHMQGGLTRSLIITAITQPHQLEEEPPNPLSQPLVGTTASSWHSVAPDLTQGGRSTFSKTDLITGGTRPGLQAASLRPGCHLRGTGGQITPRNEPSATCLALEGQCWMAATCSIFPPATPRHHRGQC